MRIEKLNDNKIRIFLNNEDLKENHINLHDFMSNSLESQHFFIDMLNLAETQVGFKTKNYKLIIEALASADGDFIFTITRTKPEEKIQQLKPRTKRQTVMPNKLLSIYKFKTFEDFCGFCSFINNSALNQCINKLRNSALVLFNDEYYLIIHNLKLNVNDLRGFSFAISEFASCMKNEDLFERKLLEHGKVNIAKNAINTCLSYF